MASMEVSPCREWIKSACFLFYWCSVNICVKLIRLGQRTLVGKTDSPFHLFFNPRFNLFQAFFIQNALLRKSGDKEFDWIALLIFFNFRTRSIIARVGH